MLTSPRPNTGGQPSAWISRRLIPRIKHPGPDSLKSTAKAVGERTGLEHGTGRGGEGGSEELEGADSWLSGSGGGRKHAGIETHFRPVAGPTVPTSLQPSTHITKNPNGSLERVSALTQPPAYWPTGRATRNFHRFS